MELEIPNQAGCIMIDSAQEAISAFHEWQDAWNTGNVETQISLMHFPHLRLAGNNKFQLYETPNDFRIARQDAIVKLNKEGWHHTSTLSIDAVQVGTEKVHIVARQSRQYADNTEYNGFDTLWIFTKIDGCWGVQFRSSFLTDSAVSI